MPIRIEDPFRDPTLRLCEKVNPFVGLLKEGAAKGSLPVLYGPYLEPLKGNWSGHFEKKMQKSPRSLVLEIGSHKGEVLTEMASNHPDTAFLGMDITFKRVVNLAQRAKTHDMLNMTSVLCNAKGLEHLFSSNELDGIIVFFPDPWANKKRQQKNRLLNEEFLGCLKKVIKPGGFFWFKTDHEPYFSEVKQVAQRMFEGDFPRKGLTSEVYTSKFERHFRSQGLETYEACWSC